MAEELCKTLDAGYILFCINQSAYVSAVCMSCVVVHTTAEGSHLASNSLYRTTAERPDNGHMPVETTI